MNDQALRERALDPVRSFIVQAPAGSGKTALLMQRFLVLLTTVQVPEECLAITFTRKAAFEMRDRILAALMRAQDPNPPEDTYTYKIWSLAKKVLECSERLEWELLSNPNRLKIQTIDALCASLTRGMPILSRLGSSPEVSEDASALYLAAAKNLLESLEKEDAWSEAVRCLVFHLDNNLFLAQRLLADLLPNRDQWLPYIGRTQSEAEWRAILESGLQSAIAEALYALQEVLPPESLMTDLKVLAVFSANQLIYTEPRIAKPEETEISYWLGLSDLLLTEEGTWRKIVTQKQGFPAPSSADNKIDKESYKNKKDQMLILLRSLEDYPEFQARLYALKNCPLPVYNEEQWALVKSLIQLLPILAAHLNIVFQEKGQVDFTEISLAANRALGDIEAPTDLALVLDNRIRHLMVDEFQDTSISQFGLLEKLTTGWMPGDGRTLFLVGDPMQSIYRFRQAEVGLFLAVKKHGINQLPIEALTLSVNFRSDSRIMTWLNTVFTEAFPKEDDISSGAICFSPSIAHQALEGATEPNVRIMPEHEQELIEEAKAIADIIRKTKTHDPKGTIAILVRSRTHLSEILPLLRQENIEYQGVDLELLINRPVIQDLMALTQALLHLGDRLAWLSILRCPWINLCLADILLLAQTAGAAPIWGALNRYASLKDLSFSAQSILARCVPILKQALMNRDRAPLRTWIWDTWIALKGHEWLYEKHSVQDADMYFDMLDKLEQQDLIREPGVLKEKMERLYAKSNTIDPLAIQIMTIHKAKGLEFDTVILPSLGRQPKAPDSPLLLWEERATRETLHYLIFAPIKAVAEKQDVVYQYLKKQKQKAEHHEALRLLYVAATRAKKHLYWLGHKPLPNSLLSFVLPWLSTDLSSELDTAESPELVCV
jgi:ATP-dependent exoDNAse (exonuclease V) beta subunit